MFRSMEVPHTTPVNLVVDGILTGRNIYRIARFSSRRADLCVARGHDNFEDIGQDPNDETVGHIEYCFQSLVNGDKPSNEQWNGLTTWHSGLSCQLFLLSPPQQLAVADFEDLAFWEEFRKTKSTVKDHATNERCQQLLVYELRRGTEIPATVGIERDGDNHACLYPTSQPFAVSNIAPGQAEFVANDLQALSDKWRAFALLKVRANGYSWPLWFPADNDVFPVRRWVEAVVVTGPADVAVSVGEATEDFVANRINWSDYFRRSLSVALRFGLVCDYQSALLNRQMLTSLRFTLAVAELAGGPHRYDASRGALWYVPAL
jgi:hypothetical protein